jgi:hypothetical protein
MKKEFPYQIKKELSIENIRIVLLDKPVKVIYNQNVFGVDPAGSILWQIEELAQYPGLFKNCPYVDIAIVNSQLVLFNWCSLRVVVDPKTGLILEKKETH